MATRQELIQRRNKLQDASAALQLQAREKADAAEKLDRTLADLAADEAVFRQFLQEGVLDHDA
eukprot:12236367-Prorocentrum_lima.AAC.1